MIDAIVYHQIDYWSKRYLQVNHLSIAYSGGRDSSALLEIVAKDERIKERFKVDAIHINHGLHAQADIWEKHCHQQCEALGISLVALRGKVVRKKDQSLEEAARLLRYRLFSETMYENKFILMAHHQDDQAETLLLRLLRGAGPKGLSSMPILRPLGKGYLLRPLLDVPQQDIKQFAMHCKLQWVEDDSNQDEKYDRNFLRKQIFPLLTQRWPHTKALFARTAFLCQQSDSLTKLQIHTDLQNIQDTRNGSLNISSLLLLPDIKQAEVVRYWLKQQTGNLPTQAQLTLIFKNFFSSRQDSNPVFQFKNVRLRRFKHHLMIQNNLFALPLDWAATLSTQHPLVLPEGLGTLIAKRRKGRGLKLPEEAILTVKFRQGGERCHPLGRLGSHPLKKLFQEWEIPSWERNTIPLIFYQNELIAVVGYCISQKWAASSNEMGWTFEICKG